MPDDSPSAATTLDAIRRGGGNVLIMSRQRMNEAGTALDEGRFDDAHLRLQEALQLLAPLAHAQAHLAIAHNGRVVRARDLEVGMVVTHVGTITEMAEAECTHDSCPGHFIITINGNEDNPVMFNGDAEIYVEALEVPNG